MATISKKGTKVFADDQLLKTITPEKIDKNLLFYYVKQDTFFAEKGRFWLWFVDEEDYAEKLRSGEYDMLMFPIRTLSNAFTVSPITDIWKKSYLKRINGAEHVIGIVEGFIEEEEKKVLIQMMSVKPGFKHNHVNTHMINCLLSEERSDFIPVFEDPTDDGYAFSKNYANAEYKWTTSHRPKLWKIDHPEAA